MGLVRRALETPGAGRQFRVVYANDIDAGKANLYRRFFPGDGQIDRRDIADVAATDIPPCELWTASFPCTDLSLAGGRAGLRGTQSGAVWQLLRLAAEMPPESKPRFLFFENVVGLLSSRAGEDLRALVRAINALGYGVDMMRVNAMYFSPQSRARLFLIATRLNDPAAPSRADPRQLVVSDARPAMILRAMREAPDLIWHARELPELPERTITLEGVCEAIPADSPRWWSRTRVDYFRAQIHPNHVARAESLQRGAGAIHVTAFRRVRLCGGVKRSVAEIRFDGLAGCLRTPKGGSAKQILVELGDGAMRVRHLTARECMRLQGVFDDPPEGIREDDLLFALGDAVCVPAVRWALDQLDRRPPTGLRASSDAPARIAIEAEAPSRSAPALSIARALW